MATHTLSQSEIYFNNGNDASWLPGDTLLITKGVKSLIHFAKVHDVIITFEDVVMANQVRFVNDCYNIQLKGDPVKKLLKTANFVFELIHDCSFEGIEIDGRINGVNAQVGLFGRIVPDLTDRRTWYVAGEVNYTLKNISFNAIDVHDVQHEGVYAGSSSPYGNTFSGEFKIPIRGLNFSMKNIKVWNTGWTGIQVNNWREGFVAENIEVDNYGILDVDGHRAGFAVGANNSGYAKGIKVSNGTGNGIQLYPYGSFTLSDFSVGENVGNHWKIVNGVNTFTPEQSIITVDDKSTVETNPKQQINFLNGVITKPFKVAIDQYRDNNNYLPANVTNVNIISPTNQSLSTLVLLVPGSITTNLTVNGAVIPPVDLSTTSITATLITRSISLNYKNTYPNSKTFIEISSDGVTWIPSKIGILPDYHLGTSNGTAPFSTTLNPCFFRTKIIKQDGAIVYSSSVKL